jgi:hypothetical protein
MKPRPRLYPSYTLAELKSWTNLEEATAKKVAEEIAARENGASTPKITPQITGGLTIPCIGRM